MGDNSNNRTKGSESKEDRVYNSAKEKCRACHRPWDDHDFDLPNGSRVEIRRWSKDEESAEMRRAKGPNGTRSSVWMDLLIWPPGCERTRPIVLVRAWAAEAMCRMLSGQETPEILPGPRWAACEPGESSAFQDRDGYSSVDFNGQVHGDTGRRLPDKDVVPRPRFPRNRYDLSE
jgi:hypothetical protein